MNPYQNRFFRIDLSFDHGDVQQFVHIVLIGDHGELAAMFGGNVGFGRTVDKELFAHAVLHQVGNGHDADAVLLTELL